MKEDAAAKYARWSQTFADAEFPEFGMVFSATATDEDGLFRVRADMPNDKWLTWVVDDDSAVTRKTVKHAVTKFAYLLGSPTAQSDQSHR